MLNRSRSFSALKPEEGEWATLEALRAELKRHNRQVLGLSAINVLVVGGLWLASYAGLYWLSVFSSSAAHGLEARPPESFGALFTYGAAALVILTAVVDHFFPNHGLRDHKSAMEIGWEFLLMIPRMTLSVTASLSAWLRLNEAELEMAAALLERLQGDRRVALSRLGQDIADRADRRKVMESLYLLGLIELRRKEDGLWLWITRAGESGGFAPEPKDVPVRPEGF
jgi:hypothetical protein